MYQKLKKYFFAVSALMVLLFSGSAYAQEYSNPSADPLARMNYNHAFDQAQIHEKYRELMTLLECDKNVFTKAQLKKVGSASPEKKDSAHIKKLQKEYTKACLSQLRNCRRWKIAEPARESLSMLLLTGGAMTATVAATNKDSLGGSFSIFAALFDSIRLLRDVIRSGYNLASPPSHSLNDFEEFFAKNKCFIPRELWPIIIEKFTLARQNPFELTKAMNFLEFSLGLTVYKKPLNATIPEQKCNQIIQELNHRIDLFFEKYEDQSQGQSPQLLKINIAKFVYALAGDTQTSPRYIYLHGPGGIGKTHFVNTLSEWMEELLPKTVYFNDLIITTEQELEGNQNQPGAFLRVLRNQLIAKKRGSIVFMDEATWLNKDHMISSCKRVFNGDKSKLSTNYFGSGLEGTGVSLKLAPMLIFVASNEKIKDPALESRFDIIEFPLPSPELLVFKAMNVIEKSRLLSTYKSLSSDQIAAWIKENNINNFRAVESQIEQYMQNCCKKQGFA